MGRFTLSWIDSTQERAQVSYPVPDTLPDGSDYQTLNTGFITFRDAVLAVQISPALRQQQYVADFAQFTPTIPTNPLNQIQQRWLIEYNVDGLTGVYTEPVPCADLSLGTAQNGLVVLPTDAGVGATLKSECESRWFVQDGVDAGGTGAVTVIRIYAEST